jgi:D-alanyl-D-alanine carboxypeptidase
MTGEARVDNLWRMRKARFALTFLVAAAVALAAGQTTAAAASSNHDPVARATRQALRAGPPGVVAAVDRGGSIRTYRAGVADRATGEPVSAAARFRIGSISKVFLATIVLQLVQEGRLSLGETLARRLPGVLPRIDEREVTLRMLLDHTSGIPDGTGALIAHPGEFGRGALSPARLVGLAARMAPTHRPGGRYSYSNTDYELLAMIVETVTGAPYTRAIRDRVLDPVGLRQTVLPSARLTLPAPFLHGYTPEGGKLRDTTRFNASWGGPSGGIVSTASDLARFGAALQRGRLLSSRSLKLMRGDRRERRVGYGLGLQRFRTSCGRVAFGHDGGMLGYASLLATSADGRLSVAVGTSTVDTPRNDAAMHAIASPAFCGRSTE